MALIVFCYGVFYVKTDLAYNGCSVLVWTVFWNYIWYWRNVHGGNYQIRIDGIF